MLKFMAKSTWVIGLITAAEWLLYRLFVKKLLPDYMAELISGIDKLEKEEEDP